MRRPQLSWAGVVSLALLAFGCAGNIVPSDGEQTTEVSPPVAPPPQDSTRRTVAPPTQPPVATGDLVPDSTGPESRPSVLVEKHNLKSVRSRMIPRVMGRDWALSVNKADSIEFLRNADPVMTAMLFRSLPVSAARIRLRFRLYPEGNGVRIVSTAHLVGKVVYPYRAVAQVLEDNLAELRADLIAGPSTMAPLVDRVAPKKK